MAYVIDKYMNQVTIVTDKEINYVVFLLTSDFERIALKILLFTRLRLKSKILLHETVSYNILNNEHHCINQYEKIN